MHRLSLKASLRSKFIPLFAIGLGAMASAAHAQTTYYWDGNGAATGSGNTTLTGTWGSTAFWGTAANGTTATTNAALTVSDTAVFTANDNSGTANNYNGTYTVTLGTAQSVSGIIVSGTSVGSGNSGGTLTLAGTATPGLTLGAGGLTINGSNGDIVLANTIGTITLGADQTWNVANAHVWTVNAAIAGNAGAGLTRTWTLGTLNGFTNVYSGSVSNGAGGGKLAITLNNSGGGTQSFTGTANTYTGKTTIARGILQAVALANAGASSSLGAATGTDSIIDIGSTTNAGSLYVNASAATSTDRVINLAGTTGGATIKSNGAATSSTVTFTGGVTNAGGGNKVLTLAGTNLGNNTISGIADATIDSSKTAVVKSEAGLWVLSGSNTYSGSTTISAGTLSVAAASSLGSNVAGNNITINGGNLLLSAATNFGANQTIFISSGGIGVGYTPSSLPTVTDTTGTAGGVYGINYTGDGAVTNLSTLYNGNWFLGSFTTGTYTGATLGSGSNSNYRLGGGGGTLTIANNVLTGANNLIAGGSGGGSVILSNGNTYTGKTTLQSGTLTVSSVNKVVSGSASSSLGAPITALNGTIDIGSGANAVALNYMGGGETSDRIINLAGTTGAVTFTNSGSGNLNFTSTMTQTGTGAKAITLGAATDNFGGTLTGLSNSGTAKVSVTKNGQNNSNWTLSGSSSYTGDTVINGGVLTVANGLSNTGFINLNGGSATQQAVLQSSGTIARILANGSGTANSLKWSTFSGFAAQGGKLTVTLSSNAQLQWGLANSGFMGTGASPMVLGSTTSDSQVEITNPFSLNTTDAFSRVIYVEKGVGGDSALLSGIISQGTGTASNNGIVKDGKGTLILSNVNTYGGPTVVRQGTLVAAGNSLSGSAGVFGTGTGSFSAPTAPSSLVLGDASTGTGGNPSLQIGGAFTVGRTISVTDSGTGNTYSVGGSTDNASTFSGAITVANGSAANNTFSVTQVATTGTNALNITGGITGAANANTKTVRFDNVGTVNVSNTGISDGAGGGKVAVVKANTGITNFTAVNTYTGTTTVSAGTLLVSGTGNINSSAAVSITGGTLDYQNNVTGLNRNVTVNGGTFKNNSTQNYTGVLTFTAGTVAGTNLAGVALSIGTGQTLSPGNSPGTMTTGAQTWATGGNYNWQILDATGSAGTGFDTIALTTGNALNITATSGGKFNINLWSLSSTGPDVSGNAQNFSSGSNYTWTLVSTDQAITGFSADEFLINTGAANGTAGFSNPAGGTFAVALADGNTDLVLTYTAVPEPGTVGLVAVGLAGVLYFRRRTRTA